MASPTEPPSDAGLHVLPGNGDCRSVLKRCDALLDFFPPCLLCIRIHDRFKAAEKRIRERGSHLRGQFQGFMEDLCGFARHKASVAPVHRLG